MSKSRGFIFGGLAAVALIAVGGFFATRTAPMQGATEFSIVSAAEAETVEALLPDFVQGDEAAPVTLIEYASFTCPHCGNWHKDIYPQLKADYIDTGKVKFIHREVYFDRFGLWAGQVAQCGGAERYFGISGILYDTQKEWIGDGQQGTIAANLRKIGLKSGLSAEQVDACLNDTDHAKQMVSTFQQNASKDEIDSTPTLVINGKKHSNMSYEDLKALLDGAL